MDSSAAILTKRNFVFDELDQLIFAFLRSSSLFFLTMSSVAIFCRSGSTSSENSL